MGITATPENKYETARSRASEVQEAIENLDLAGVTVGIAGSGQDFEATLFVACGTSVKEAHQVVTSISDGRNLPYQAEPNAEVFKTRPVLTELEVGEIYRLRHQIYAGYDHRPDYQEGKFIHVLILSGPDKLGIYQGTTRGPDGKHFGPGGGWSPNFEKTATRFRAFELEKISPV